MMRCSPARDLAARCRRRPAAGSPASCWLLAWLVSIISCGATPALAELGRPRHRRSRRRSSAALPAAQDDVAVLVAGVVDAIAERPPLVTARKWCGCERRLHRIGRDLHVAVGAVLEADRAGEARRQLAMDLALGGAGADRAPRRPDRRCIAAWSCRGTRCRPAGRDCSLPSSSAAGQPQALVDVEAAVEVRIVDQALPADGGARLLEIDPHHDLEAVGELFAQVGEALGVVDGRHGIMDRAGADDDQQAVIGAVQDGVDGVAGAASRRVSPSRCAGPPASPPEAYSALSIP